MKPLWIWLTLCRRLGTRGQRALLREFGSPATIYEADAEAFARAGLSPALQKALLDKDLGPARAVLTRCEKTGVRAVTLADEAYPPRLRQMEDAPIVLYCKGTLPGEERPVIGLVGARNADAQGLALARRLGREIAACGGSVTTGIARGIDAESAEGALECGGAVIGVLGCGPDRVYPAENAALFARVAAQGCLVSEYPPGTAPNARNFPVRNRLISALADGVVVIRAAEHSGSLITARWAAEQGRDVFAVPGAPADPLSRGSNALLREGALAVETGWDVLRRYEYRYPGVLHEEICPPASAGVSCPPPARQAAGKRQQQAVSDMALTPAQEAIVTALRDGPLQLDALIDRTGLPAAKVLPQLTLLQIKKTVLQKPGKQYELSGG